METEQKELEAVIAPNGILPPSRDANLAKLTPAYEPQAQWQQVARSTTDFLGEFPEYVSSFFYKNQRSLSNLALIITAVITLKLVIAVVSAINDVPLLAPFFELIGLTYFTWFSWRYLAKSETRQELTQKIRLWKQEVLGE
ncbi:CAAD domain-containing protein [Anabaenopsis tanganyikae CS-531]|uniref:CAAD domain-containing protein n=2 Tax=Anabaenopsis TaxID=110103 RepID=A0ABT6K9P1_9CYAN|nr:MULTISPECIES: CAAD domain-containing protein [Anabaenopsis]MDB9538845.1 CAAD domain-containing protein [Anabaenopsis arnoldii]MDH6091122.1 CAAD domain-containing protein [Anabaenopsis arnoldii]MDH6100602.1 CAAD domain-containing protein [Anabaenopsis sp. FSS-46]MDH6104524.1 CAAD domain-containing protein [Anabaenopsis tanganyikae CS-531]